MRMATYASVATALVLILVKFAGWLLTDSISLLSSLIDSLLDATASLVNLLAVRHALSPPDREHRFGHGKAEPLAALAQAAFIAGSAIFLVIEAGHRLVSPQPISHTEVGIVVMIFAIVATYLLVRVQRYVIRRTGSLAIQADELHYFGDLLVSGAVITALLLVSQLGWQFIDPAFALCIAVYILKNSWDIARGALDMLMDRELPDRDRDRIKEIVRRHPSVISLHDLRTRAAGPKTFIQLHLEMDGRHTLYQAHEIADVVQADLCAAFPGAEVIIHQDPRDPEKDTASVG